VDLPDHVELAQAVFDGVREVAILSNKDQEVVLLLLVVEKVLEFARWYSPVRLDDDQQSKAAEFELIEFGQNPHLLIRVAALRLEDAG